MGGTQDGQGERDNTAAIEENQSRRFHHPFGIVTVSDNENERPLTAMLVETERTRDPLWIARIEAVHRVLRRSSVPHVLTIESVETTGSGELLLTHTKVEGASLANVLRGGAVGLEVAVSVLRQVCRSLAAAHKVGVEHQVLGPASIVFLGSGEPYKIGILDYGIAAVYEGHEGSECVELHPMTPERVVGGGSERSQDVYLIGCLAYWMLAGAPPFPADDFETLRRRHGIEEAPRLDQLPESNTPAAFADVVARALEKDPSDRYASVEELERALRKAQKDAGIEIPWDAVPIAISDGGPAATPVRRSLASGPVQKTSRARAISGESPRPPKLLDPRSPTMIVTPATLEASSPAPKPSRPGRRFDSVLRWMRGAPRRTRLVGASVALAATCACLFVATMGAAPLESARDRDRPSIGSVRQGPASGLEAAGSESPGSARDEGVAWLAEPPPVPGPFPASTREPSNPDRAGLQAAAEPSGESPRRQPAREGATLEEPEPTEATSVLASTREPAGKKIRRCRRTRQAALDARRVHDWQGLLRHTDPSACWSSSGERQALRVKALMELGRFSDCERLGASMSQPDPHVRRWITLCTRRNQMDA